jgi:hypothetical protein
MWLGNMASRNKSVSYIQFETYGCEKIWLLEMQLIFETSDGLLENYGFLKYIFN